MIDIDRVESALAALRPGLTADGFDLRIGSLTEDDRVEVILEALPNACHECLVPEHLLVRIVEEAIREQGAMVNELKLVKVGFA